MTSLCDGHRFMGGLQRLADDLGCQRLGAEHQAGSDSLLTKDAFFALVRAKFNDKPKSGKKGKNNGTNNNTKDSRLFDDTRFANELYGYGNNHTVRKGPVHVRDISSMSLSNATNE